MKTLKAAAAALFLFLFLVGCEAAPEDPTEESVDTTSQVDVTEPDTTTDTSITEPQICDSYMDGICECATGTVEFKDHCVDPAWAEVAQIIDGTWIEVNSTDMVELSIKPLTPLSTELNEICGTDFIVRGFLGGQAPVCLTDGWELFFEIPDVQIMTGRIYKDDDGLFKAEITQEILELGEVKTFVYARSI